MTYHNLTHEGRIVQHTQAESVIEYFRKNRAENIRRYFAAKYWPDRRTARSWVLHYGRLIRKLEGRV